VIEGKRVRQDTGYRIARLRRKSSRPGKCRWPGPAGSGFRRLHHSTRSRNCSRSIWPRDAAEGPASQRRDQVVLARFRKRWGRYGLDQLNSKAIEDHLTERLREVTWPR